MCNILQEGPGNEAIQIDEECKNLMGDSRCRNQLRGFYGGNFTAFCNLEHFQKQCQRTCRLCKTNQCEDVNYNPYNASPCVNDLLYSTFPCMEENQQTICMRTCGLCSDYCEDVSSSYCSDYKIKQTPYGCNNPKMMILCKRTCGYCPARVCPNSYSDYYCEENKYSCKYSSHLKKYCKKTCKVTDC